MCIFRTGEESARYVLRQVNMRKRPFPLRRKDRQFGQIKYLRIVFKRMVELRRFERPTPSVRGKCSPAELQPHSFNAAAYGLPR